MTGVPGSENSRAFSSSILRRSLPSSGREATTDAQVDPHLRIARVGAVHVVALFVGDHLQGQLVVVAQEHRPLRAVGQVRGLVEDVDDRHPVLALHRHEQPRHDREVEVHVALVAVTEVRRGVLGPLVRLGQQHAVVVVLVDVGPQLTQERVGLGQVLAVGALTLEQVRHRVQTHAVDAHVHPVVHDLVDRRDDRRVVVVQVGLVGVEAVPEVRPGHRVPGPVRGLEVTEDDPRVGVLLGIVAPDVEVAFDRPRPAPPRPLEPGVLVGGVVEHQLGDDAQVPPVCLGQQPLEGAQVAVGGVDAGEVRDVVAVVAQRRRVEGQQPHRRDAQVAQVVEALQQPREVADAVAVAIRERLDVEFVDDRVPVPLRLGSCRCGSDHAGGGTSLRWSPQLGGQLSVPPPAT